MKGSHPMPRATIKVELFAAHEKKPPKYLGWNREQSSVARIDGLDYKNGDFRKVYLHGYLDYSQANSAGSRGIYKLYFVPDGLYEVTSRITWRKVDHYFVRVVDGAQTRMTLQEAVECLSAD